MYKIEIAIFENTTLDSISVPTQLARYAHTHGAWLSDKGFPSQQHGRVWLRIIANLGHIDAAFSSDAKQLMYLCSKDINRIRVTYATSRAL